MQMRMNLGRALCVLALLASTLAPGLASAFNDGVIIVRKFHDLDGNGARGPGEPFLNDWTFELRLGATLIETGVTADVDLDNSGGIDPESERGVYVFDDLSPGSYSLVEIDQAGWTPTTQNTFILSVSDNTFMINFGNARRGAIHGYKFNDLNGNGVDDGEPRLPDVTITLSGESDGGIVQFAQVVTDANGEYWFTELRPQDYTVTETPPAGSTPTTPAEVNVTLNSGDALVAEPGQAQLPPTSPLTEVVLDELAFGNQFTQNRGGCNNGP